MRPLCSAVFAACILCAVPIMPAGAVDTNSSSDLPDLASVRHKVKARDFKSAIADLNLMIDKGLQHADIYNLLGFSLRKEGDLKTAQTFYRKALEFDPDHKGALEYQGELYVQTGDLAKARENAARLAKLCPQGCEELEDLQKAIAAAGTTN